MSAAKKRGLGRGLGSLIPTAAPPVDAEQPQQHTPTPETPGSTHGLGPVHVPDATETVGGAYFAEVPIDQIRPNAVQPPTKTTAMAAKRIT